MLVRGRFVVPAHQRFYDWETANVCALLENVEEGVANNTPCHFLGTIMLIPQRKGVWLINDGQQRIITFLLICAWLCRTANNAGDDRTMAMMLQLMFDLDRMHNKTMDDADNLKPRLTPQFMDETNFLLIIRGEVVGANGKLTAAWDAIESFFSAPHRQERKWQKAFADFLCNKLRVVEIEVDNTLNRHTIFETLNHHGKKLENVDMIKNHLFSFLDTPGEEVRMVTVEKNIKAVYSNLRHVRDVSAYVRCHLQTEFGFLHGGKDQFYPDVKKRIAERGDDAYKRDLVFDLSGKLAKTGRIALFQTIAKPSTGADYIKQLIAHSATTTKKRNMHHFLGDLRLYSIAQPVIFALLCLHSEAAAKDKKTRAKLADKCCQFLASYLQRVAHTQGSFKPSAYEADLANLSNLIVKGECNSSVAFLDYLKQCHAADLITGPNYTEEMRTIVYRSVSKAKLILARMVEYQQPEIVGFRDSDITVEHILPKGEKYLAGWSQFDEDARAKYIDRLGNLTLLHRRDNKPQEKYNRNFAAKKEHLYAGCVYEITKALCNHDDWSPAALESRQTKLAKLAAEIWNFK